MMRTIGCAVVLALVVAGCAGEGPADPEEPTNTVVTGGAGTTLTTTAVVATTLAPEALSVCELVSDEDLQGLFGDPVPRGAEESGSNGEITCIWGPADGNLNVSIWPSEAFYSSCEQCRPIDVGQEGFVDVTDILGYSAVRLDGQTLTVTAAGLGVDEATLENLVRSVATQVS
ncbi:MAG: hypothetical protein WBM90_13265 [Acidimicrobiia bacterium]